MKQWAYSMDFEKTANLPKFEDSNFSLRRASPTLRFCR